MFIVIHHQISDYLWIIVEFYYYLNQSNEQIGTVSVTHINASLVSVVCSYQAKN